MEVVQTLKEALKQRIGADSYRMWFANGVEFSVEPYSGESQSSDAKSDSAEPNDGLERGTVGVKVRGQFALERLRKNFLREIRGAAMQACGTAMQVELCLDEPPAEQADLPLGDEDQSSLSVQVEKKRKPRKPRRAESRPGKTKSLSSLLAAGAASDEQPKASSTPSSAQPELPNLSSPQPAEDAERAERAPAAAVPPERPSSRSSMTVSSFVLGPSNKLAHTAMMMVCQSPSQASPLFVSGPTGTGKTHILAAIADQLRRRHRMRTVMHLSAEQFTNDFINSVGNSGIAAFRRRYRDVDALLIDDVQFLGSKKATLRELLYTVETLANAGRPLVFSGLQPPGEIAGLSGELSGRLAAGLVCPIQPLDSETREIILRRWISDRCQLPLPDAMVEQLNAMLAGDGRVISGVVNLINTLQRMLRRLPSMNELRQYGGQLLSATRPIATLNLIESAVCETFQLDPETLRGGSQSRAVSEPRMLAMYLSRKLTSSAYAEIAGHFGGKSHSTAIAAEKKVRTWLADGKPIGRGPAAICAQQAIDRVEDRLRTG